MLFAQLQEKTNPSKKVTWIDVTPMPKKQDMQLRKQIVQTSPAKKVDAPKPDAYLGWQNQVVDQETVGRKKSVAQEMKTANLNKPTQESRTPQKERASQELSSLSKLGLQMFKPIHEKDSIKPDEPDWATPGTRPEDDILGVTRGERTALNTKEFVFYSYFQRIRQRLDRAWVPILREKLIAYHRAGRHLAGDMDHTTRVLVILNSHGEITRVQLIGESGTNDLDDAAIAAFNRAGPFPNPPKEMVDNNNEIKIPWDFILKT
jgi:TonB family protein